MIILNDVTRFSNEQELADAMQGKYGKDYQADYKLTIVKNVCFVNTVKSCTIKNLPDHYAFKYYDTAWHTVNEDTNTITVDGVACFFFVIKNT
jgi:hypothetical protein